jgi:lipopolysaccharide transport system permease protein
MFATPTIYMQPSPGAQGGGLHALLALNPMTGLIASFRAACLGGPLPWGQFAISTGCVLVMFLVGCLYFRRVEDGFADII